MIVVQRLQWFDGNEVGLWLRLCRVVQEPDGWWEEAVLKPGGDGSRASVSQWEECVAMVLMMLADLRQWFPKIPLMVGMVRGINHFLQPPSFLRDWITCLDRNAFYQLNVCVCVSNSESLTSLVRHTGMEDTIEQQLVLLSRSSCDAGSVLTLDAVLWG